MVPVGKTINPPLRISCQRMLGRKASGGQFRLEILATVPSRGDWRNIAITLVDPSETPKIPKNCPRKGTNILTG